MIIATDACGGAENACGGAENACGGAENASGGADQSNSPSDNTVEARRVMEICNACRYCEGLCATFEAMTRRRTFTEPDLDYLANLCHNCTACFHDCQYASPHAFDINVPASLTHLRVETYEKYAWPGFLARAFQQNGLLVSLITALAVISLLSLSLWLLSDDVLFASHRGPGSFYQIIGHGLMVLVATVSFGFSVLAMTVATVKFWRATGKNTGLPRLSSIMSAIGNVAKLKYLDGGHGEGCSTLDDSFSNQRRYYHQLTMWGFLVCFASTCVATFYDYGLGLQAPYPVTSLPVLLGIIGGSGLLIGPAGLAWHKIHSDQRSMPRAFFGMDFAFIASLFTISLTGLLLLAFRETQAMGVLLVIHLGFVLGFFIMLPYSKFVHAAYRFASLVRFAEEER